MLTVEFLKRRMTYDPMTGLFTRNEDARGTNPAGSVCGFTRPNGYVDIQINGRSYRAHRLAWFYLYGEWPVEIDHINGVRDDNRRANLRQSTRLANTQNRRAARRGSASGFNTTAHRFTNAPPAASTFVYRCDSVGELFQHAAAQTAITLHSPRKAKP